MKTLQLLVFFLIVHTSFSQPVKERLAAAMKTLEADSQMRHAIVGLSVVDTKTGKPVYEHNAQVGLAAASTQKLFTSGAAFELLGHDFKYYTKLCYVGKIVRDSLQGLIYVVGSGDPTFGSWRFANTRSSIIIKLIVDNLRKAGIKKMLPTFELDYFYSFDQPIPDGWIWQDIGNYYGAGTWSLNWKENQYDIVLQSSGKVGEPVNVILPTDTSFSYSYNNHLSSAEKGTGDNAYIYLTMDGHTRLLKGTIPVAENHFTISGSQLYPHQDFFFDLAHYMKTQSMISSLDSFQCTEQTYRDLLGKTVFEHYSPPLDSINYWFLKKSINLYGEALVKTMALQKIREANTDSGVAIVKDFWNQHGIDKSAINIIDGSGLSPQNRVTADAEVKVLQYAKTRPWFASFYYALPEYNGMKMKSGSIGGARAFAGYHTAKDGKEYTYSIIVNNYDGSSGAIVRKLYKVLDELK